MRNLILSFGCLLALSVNAAQVGVQNGTFDSNGAGWVDTSFGYSTANPVSFGSGAAVLQTQGDGSIWSDSITGIAQGTNSAFDTFDSATAVTVNGGYLNFDFLFDSFVDSGESGSSYADNSFTVTLLTENDFDNFGLGLAFSSGWDFLLTDGFASLDVSAYSGLTVIIAFDLYDEDDGFDSRLTLDNIEFSNDERTGSVSEVPVPPAAVLFFSGLIWIRRFLKT